MKKIRCGKHTIEISNEDKILFTGKKITKGDLVNYYKKISKYMLPYLKNRPISMHRFPDGITKEGFFQKKPGDYFPKWVKTKSIKKKEGGSIKQVICNDTATLVYLAGQATISLHTWLSKEDKLEYPDKIIFDLDSPKNKFKLACKVAKELKNLLDELRLKSFIMTTGSKGLHVIIPLKRNEKFDQVREFAKNIATILIKKDPKNITLEQRKEKRKNRLFIDILRNAYAQTSIAPYSVRALKGAPVATPLAWNELTNSSLRADKYNINNIFKRLKEQPNPWKSFNRSAKSLKEAKKRLENLKK
ncbi:non-homologous end-joining DNA ligase [Candidatus Babeliales bacterium]|nr:non-homologous end-joining DNA ligase [Candidatus Babeliales bacterium]